jgi:ABC-type oligopeptide transport system substrate-binding subunit
VGLGARRPRPFALATALLALASAACTAPPPEQRAEGSVPVPGPTGSPTGEPVTSLRLSTLEPDSLDPQAIDAPQELLLVSQLFDGLVAYDPETLKLTPAVASRWRFEQGGKVFVFKLRKGIRYHDGSPVAAPDFVFAWSRLADPIASAPFSFLLERVAGYEAYQQRPVSQLEGVSALDDRTLEVRLSSPWPDFVSLLGHPALSPVPPSASQSTFAAQPVGNGPFRMASPLAAGAPVLLERFERYYMGRPAVDRLEFEVVEEAEDSWPDFLAGELDQATIPASALTVAQSQFGTAGVAPLARVLYCAFNQSSERLRDGNLRLAASLALDRQQVAARVYGGLVTPATGLVPPPLPGAAANACGARCRQNLEEARRLVREVPRSSRTFALDYTRSSVGDALARTLATQLEQAGLRVQPRPHTEPEYAKLLRTGRQQFFCLVWTADYPRQQAVLETLLGGGSPDNHAGFDDKKINDLLGKARTERAPAKRQGLYRRVEDVALERMHLVPVVWFRSHLAVQRYVEGLAVDPLGLFDASTLRIAS